eukprot:Hpha_TRINITY_DN15900_c0_g3::TRINITY_DN15900_c0_g3_i1::g.73700::m.73700
MLGWAARSRAVLRFSGALSAGRRWAMGGLRDVQSEEEYEKTVKTDAKVAVDFHAGWCQACKELMPKYEALSKAHPDVTFLKVDVDDLEEIAASEEASGLPYFVFYSGGTRVATLDAKKALAGGLEPQVQELAGAAAKQKVAVVADEQCEAAEFADPGSGNKLRFFIADGGGALTYTVNGDARPSFKVLVASPAGDQLKFPDIDKGAALPKGPGLAGILGKILGLAKRAGIEVKRFDMATKSLVEGFPTEVDE